MRLAEWHQLRAELRSKADIRRVLTRAPHLSYDTLAAVFDQLYQRYLTTNMHRIRQRIPDAVRLHHRGNSLLTIASWLDVPPVVLVRRFLEATHQMDRRAVTRALRHPDRLPDARLRDEVRDCLRVDDMFGPRGDRVRAVLGVEYEYVLCDMLRARALEFETEHDLRRRGSFKTPDVLLAVPVAFHGKVVCWIDSKAKFADEYTLNKDYADAVKSYANRFGPGMVIYWFGLIDDLVCPMTEDDAVLITDHFPDDMATLPGTFLPPSNQQIHVTQPLQRPAPSSAP